MNSVDKNGLEILKDFVENELKTLYFDNQDDINDSLQYFNQQVEDLQLSNKYTSYFEEVLCTDDSLEDKYKDILNFIKDSLDDSVLMF